MGIHTSSYEILYTTPDEPQAFTRFASRCSAPRQAGIVAPKPGSRQSRHSWQLCAAMASGSSALRHSRGDGGVRIELLDDARSAPVTLLRPARRLEEQEVRDEPTEGGPCSGKHKVAEVDHEDDSRALSANELLFKEDLIG